VRRATFEEVEPAAAKLAAAVGETLALLRRLAAAAAAYSDADYMRHASGLRDHLDCLAEVAARLRRDAPAYVAGALAAHGAAAAAREGAPLGRVADARADAALAAALKRLGPAPDLELPPAPHGAWRYPPRRYVLFKRKGVPGGWAAPLAMPGLERPLPRVARRRDDLPGGPPGGSSGGGRRSRGRGGGGSGRGGGGRSGAADPGFSGMFD
jgi:hypothetical protein